MKISFCHSLVLQPPHHCSCSCFLKTMKWQFSTLLRPISKHLKQNILEAKTRIFSLPNPVRRLDWWKYSYWEHARYDKDMKDKQLRVWSLVLLQFTSQFVHPQKTSCFLSVFIGKASQGYLAYTQILVGFKFMKKITILFLLSIALLKNPGWPMYRRPSVR